MMAAFGPRELAMALLIAFSGYPPAASAADRCETNAPVDSQVLPEPFMQAGLWGYRSAGGEVVVNPRFQFAGEFSEHGLAAVFEDASRGWQLIGVDGELVIGPLPFENGPDRFIEGLARYRSQGKIGFFDERGCVVIEARFDWAFPFSQGRAAVCEGCAPAENGEHATIEGGRWGFVDPAGELVIPLQYERASSFEDGRAGVTGSSESYFIDRFGNRLPQN